MKRRTASTAVRILRWSGGAVIVVVGLFALLDLTPLLRLREVRVEGAEPELMGALRERIETNAIVSYFGYRFGFASLLHVDTHALREEILGAYPELSDASVRREWPHAVNIEVTERVPIGIWCRPAESETCRLVDRTGSRWGGVVPSVGPLLVLITDERQDDEVSAELLNGILASLDGLVPLNVPVRRVILPDAEPGGMRLETASGTTLAMDALGDIGDQLSTLAVFQSDRAKEAAPAPVTVIDLRTPGRVYFR